MKNSAYKIQKAPQEAKLFNMNVEWKPELVDYASHPAYAPLIASAGFADRLSALWRFSKSSVLLLIKRIIRYELIPRETREPRSLAGWFRFAGAGLKNAVGLYPRARQVKNRSDVFDFLDTHGCCVIKMDDSVFENLENKAEQHFDRLEQRRQKTASENRDFDESRGSVDAREFGNELFNTINDILGDSGVFDAASKYLGRPVRLVDVNPQINDKTDGFWRIVFPDLKMKTTPDKAYYHRDASGGDLKAIIYMSDVGPQNGPFSYVIGSNKLLISKVDDLIAEVNDHNGFAGTTLEMRRQFAALPKKLRQKCTFGNDLTEKSELSKQIDSGVWQITGSKGSIVLFDTKGVHRGGLVAEGKRKVITTIIG